MENQELKQAGLKVTAQRVKILQLLEAAENPHMSAEEVHKALSDAGEKVGLATVYRVLTHFVEAHLVKRRNFSDDHAVFELNQKSHHDHLVCVECGTVQEFVDEIIEAQQRKIAKKANFEMTEHSLNIYGICAKCRQV